MVRSASIVALFACGGCAQVEKVMPFTASLPDQPALVAYPLQDEAALDVAAKERPKTLNLVRTTNYGLVPEGALDAKLNAIARRLIAASPVPGADVEVRLAASSSFNGYAHPDGLIVLGLGVVQNFENEDAAAFIIGHEIGHVLLGHASSDWYVDLQKRTAGVLGLANSADLIGRQLVGDRGSGELGKWGKIVGRTALASEELVAPSFSRKQELQADLIAIDLMVKAGYNPFAAADILNLMAEWEASQGKRRSKLVTELSGLGKEMLDAELKARLGDQSDISKKAQELHAQISTHAEDAMNEVVAQFSARHYEAGRRNEAIDAYLTAQYGELEPPDLSEEDWQALKRRRSVQALFQRYDTASDAAIALSEGHADDARAEASQAIQAPAQNHAWTRLVHADVMRAEGRDRERLASIRAALDGPEPSLKPFLDLATYYEDHGKFRQAIGVLNDARGRFEATPAPLPALIRLNVREGEDALALKLLTECRTTAPAFADACEQGAARDDGTDAATGSMLAAIRELWEKGLSPTSPTPEPAAGATALTPTQ